MTFRSSAITVLALSFSLAPCGVGSAATIPAQTPVPHLTTLGDSITFGLQSSDFAKTSYAALLANKLGAKLTNLGKSGETTIPEPNAFFTGESVTGLRYAPMGGVIGDEVPSIPLDTTIVTLWIGTNDLWMTTSSTLPDFSNVDTLYPQVTQAYVQSFSATVAAIRARVPSARLVLATNVNPADKGSLTKFTAGPYLRYREALTNLTNAINAVIAAQGATVADLHCDPAMYDLSSYPNEWNVHPNHAGHARIADDFYNAIQHGGTAQQCSYSTVTASP